MEHLMQRSEEMKGYFTYLIQKCEALDAYIEVFKAPNLSHKTIWSALRTEVYSADKKILALEAEVSVEKQKTEQWTEMYRDLLHAQEAAACHIDSLGIERGFMVPKPSH